MKTFIAILFLLFSFQHAMANESNNNDNEIILPISPPQKLYSRYQRDFNYHHDRGFYLNAELGPSWVHSISEPEAKALRFNAKFGLGWYVADKIALFGAVWGNFLEQASSFAFGPGTAFLFDGPNIGLDISLGIARVFNPINSKNYKNFSESVFATRLALAKYWWLSPKTSLGISLNSGLYGFTLSQGSIGTFGFNGGLGFAFLWG